MPQPQIRALKKDPNKREKSSQGQPTPSKDSPSKPTTTPENQSSSSKSKKQQTQQEGQNQETTTRFFQAIGVIEGEVSLDEQGKTKILLANKEYPLLPLPKHVEKLQALQEQIKETGNAIKRLVVYPKVIHFPDQNTPQQILFQLLGLEGKTKHGTIQELDNMEFKIAGLWQFIPVCRIPCISVFKNFSPERLEWIKQADIRKRVKFMKASHLPLLWKQAPVKPFKYNPKAKQQKKAAFVRIKAKFLPNKDAFAFDSLIESPTTDKIPKYLKVSKKDKQLAQQQQKEITNTQSETDQSPTQPTKEQQTESHESSIDDTINRIAKETENWKEIANQNQGKQAEAIRNQLIAYRVKDENYSLPKNYLSNWKYGKNLPKETSKHYPAYRLWQLIHDR
jgi:hypothetical protein